jgi:hypothetical protein
LRRRPEGVAEGVGVRHDEAAVEHQLRRVAGLLLRHRTCKFERTAATCQHQPFDDTLLLLLLLMES